MYPADGRKLPDIYTHPPELRDELQQSLGQFPLFNFWGPNCQHRFHALDRPVDVAGDGEESSDINAGLLTAP